MSENLPIYSVSTKKRLSPSALKRRACCKPFSDERYRAPSADEIASLIEFSGWTQQQFAQVVGVSTSSRGSSTIRRWKYDSESARTIPYAACRLALLESGLVQLGNSH